MSNSNSNTIRTPQIIPEPPKYATLPRLWNWHDRFHPLITQTRKAAIDRQLAFEWGSQTTSNITTTTNAIQSAYDCMSFCGKIVESLTGLDVYREWLGDDKYDSPIGAYKLMRSRGFSNVDQLLRSLFKEITYPCTHIGDLVVVKTQLDPDNSSGTSLSYAGGVACSPYFYCMMNTGLGKGRLKDAYSFYKVGL